MLDCVTARRPTPPAYSAGLQRGLGRSRRPCARVRIAEPAPSRSLEKLLGACPSSLAAPPRSQPTFDSAITLLAVQLATQPVRYAYESDLCPESISI
jgi:hypothetical protein